MLALLVAFPVALGCAFYLCDRSDSSRSRFGFRTFVSTALDALTAVPSIVFGIVGNQVFCRYFDFGYSLLAGGLTLGVMIWPYMTRAFQETIEGVPRDIYLQSRSLGLSSYTYFRRIILSSCLPGMLLGVVLALSRALAETSALLFTSGYSDRLPESLFDSGRVLSIHILDLAMNVTGADQNAYASGVVLILFLLLINTLFTASFRLYRKMI
jgi:phosphate transport system permease protein